MYLFSFFYKVMKRYVLFLEFFSLHSNSDIDGKSLERSAKLGPIMYCFITDGMCLTGGPRNSFDESFKYSDKTSLRLTKYELE